MNNPARHFEKKPCCLPSLILNTLFFLAGAAILMSFSILQKILVGRLDLIFQLKGYLTPFLYGGVTGTLLGQWYRRLKEKESDLLQAYDETLAGWAKAIEMRDKVTDDHTQRVVALTDNLARAMNISGTERIHLKHGALLHDIGKIGIPDAILSKPGQLTAEEREIMQMHPQIAKQMLEEIEFLRPALCIPCCHHERWDGSGYPNGFKGEEIPFKARIFAVTDVWDALTSDRPYRKAWSQKDALAYIEDNASKLFDPTVVRAFSHYIRPLND